MSAIITNPEDVRRYVRDAVIEVIRQELPDLVTTATRKELYTREEVLDLTGWSDRTLQHLRDTRQIEFVQHGRKILYPSKELHAFLDEHRVVPRDQNRGGR